MKLLVLFALSIITFYWLTSQPGSSDNNPSLPKDDSDQNDWFKKVQSFAQDGLNTAKEALNHAPEYVDSLSETAKKLSNTVSNQATELVGKAEQIYDQITNDNKNGTSHDEEQKGIFGSFYNKINELSSSVKEKVKDISISETIHAIHEKSQNLINVDSLKEKTSNAMNTVTGALENLDLKGTLASVGEKMKSIPEKVSGKYLELTQSSNHTEETQNFINVDSLKETASNVMNKVTDSVTEAWNNIDLKGAVSSVGEKMKSIPEKVSEKYTELTENSNKAEEGKNSSWIGESFNNIGTKIKQTIPEGSINMKERVDSVYQGVKENTFSVFSTAKEGIASFGEETKEKIVEIFYSAKEGVFKIGGNAKDKFSWVSDQAFEIFAPSVDSVMNLFSWIGWIWRFLPYRNIISWLVPIIFGCLVLKFVMFLLRITSWILDLLKTPLQAISMFSAFIKKFYSKEKADQKKQENSQGSQKIEPSHPENIGNQRHGSSQEEWQRQSTVQEPQVMRIRDLNQQENMRRFEEIKEKEERFYNYYRCYGCNKQWETVTIGKGPVQPCQDPSCGYVFGPYHQDPLLNNKQKSERFDDKIKME